MRIVCFVEFGFGTVALREFARGNNVTLVRRGTPTLFERRKLSGKLFLARFSKNVREHTRDVVGQAAHEAGVSVKWTRSANSPEFVGWLESQKADLIAVAGFSQILKPRVINAARFAVNFHPSLLPAYRGPAPSFWIIKNRERESGVSCHVLVPGVDSGSILFQERFAVPLEMTAEQHEEKAAALCAPLVGKLLEAIAAGTLQGEVQDESRSSYYGFPPG
jgi:methionyl-tRNA formyltransferase